MGMMARIAALANKGVTGIGIAALGALPLIVFYDVTARYVFNAPTIWATEIATYLLQLLVFLPMGLLLHDNAHIRSTLLTDKLSTGVRHVLHWLSLLLVAVFAACVSWLGGELTVYSWQHSQVSATLLAVPLWLPYALIPLGGFLLFLNALGGLIEPSAESR